MRTSLSHQTVKLFLMTALASYTTQCKSEQKGESPVSSAPPSAQIAQNVGGQSGSPALPLPPGETDAAGPSTGSPIPGESPVDTKVTSPTSSSSQGAKAGSDLYSMTPAQLSQVPAISLESEVNKLREQNKLENAQLRKIQAFNAAMCQRMETLKKDCIAQHLLVPALGASDLTCTPGEAEAESEIEVDIKNAGSYRFRLKANKDYISDEFSAGRTGIRFTRTDNRVVKAPRFREVTSLTLVSVTPNSKIELGRIQHPADISNQDSLSASLKILLYVNGSLLVDLEKGDGLKLSPNTKTKSELLIAPEDILKMGRTESCIVTLDEINEIRRKAEGAP